MGKIQEQFSAQYFSETVQPGCFAQRLGELIDICKRMSATEKEEFDNLVGYLCYKIIKEGLLDFGHLNSLNVSFKELPNSVSLEAYEGTILNLMDVKINAAKKGNEIEKLAATLVCLTVTFLHPKNSEPLNLGAAQVASEICDLQMRKYHDEI